MPWRSWLNAEIYDRFVREQRIYGWLNRELVGLAAIPGAARILDLGCGTGATTLACLPGMDARAEIVGIDASEEMVRVARANVLDPRARFEVGAVAEAGRLEGTFDRIVCNAAFWQFPAAGPVLEALARRATPGCRLVFNVPAERVVGEGTTIHPFQVALRAQIETELGRRFEGVPVLLDRERLEATAAEHGFALTGVERRVYRGLQQELMELMSIPAMIGPLTSGLDDAQREAALRRARERSSPELEVRVPWLYFILERRPDRATHSP